MIETTMVLLDSGDSMDRDTKFSEAFRVILEQAGVEAVRLPARSPNLSPNLERFLRSVKEECLERMVFFGERSLQVAVAEFLSHFHAERDHQGRDNRLIEPGEEVGAPQVKSCAASDWAACCDTTTKAA
jgi:transposase InsO family protein